MEKLRSDVVSAVRSCLISTKGKVSVRQLCRDYYTLLDEKIPYSKLGYNRLEDFLQTEPSIIMSKDHNGEYFVAAKADAKTSHIVEMVAKQRPGKRKPASRVRFSQAPAATSKWRPKYSHTSQTSHRVTSPRLQKMEHKQILEKPPAPKVDRQPAIVANNTTRRKQAHTVNVPSKVVVPPSSTINTRMNMKRITDVLGNRNNNNNITNHKDTPLESSSRMVKGHFNSSNIHTNGDTVTLNRLRDTADSHLTNRRRITQKMEEMSLTKENTSKSANVPSFTQPFPPEVTSPTFKLPPDLSRTDSMGSAFSTHSTGSTNGRDSPFGNDMLPSPPCKTPEFVRTDDPLKDLETFTSLHKLGQLEVVAKPMKMKRCSTWTCKIQVGNYSCTNYPEEFDNPEAVKNYCAEKALKDLLEKYGKRKALLLSSDTDVLERIPPMLEKCQRGIWVHQLKMDYAQQFNEQLPEDWLKLVDTVPTIQIERCLNDYVLRHCDPDDKVQFTSSLSTPHVSVPSNTVKFGADGKLSALITCFVAANEIWCRQFNSTESKSYNNMMGRLDILYTMRDSELKPSKIIESSYYVAKYDNSFYRIKTLTVNDEEAACFFIDFGFEGLIGFEDIYQLREEFADTPAQAFVCRLYGLECFYDVSTESLEDYCLKEVTLELAPDYDGSDSCFPCSMYDYETGDSINEEILTILAIESAPKLTHESPSEVIISNIEDNGDIYVRTSEHTFEILNEIIKEVVSDNDLSTVWKPVKKVLSSNKIYLTQDSNKVWCRVKLIDWSENERFAQMYFIDRGDDTVIEVKTHKLYPAEALSEVLKKYPEQVVKVKMMWETLPENFKTLVEKVMPVGTKALCKIISRDSKTVPYGEFFIYGESGLFCINKSIALELELKKSEELKATKERLNLKQSQAIKNMPSAGTLKQPPLPKKNDYFKVKIPFAVNPYNFFVQPLDTTDELNDMMDMLQQRYREVHFSPLSFDQILPGSIYASKNKDGFWYRTSVIKVINTGSITVFYCDFGFYENLDAQKLIPLDIEFLRLPYQALKAKLSGIKPSQNNWTMDDCNVFKELVEKKQFYSVLVDVEKDILYESDIVLKLILIDTSGEKDIDIGQVLVEQNIAIKE